MAMQVNTAPRLVRLPEVRTITSLSTSEIYRRIDEGRFPRQIRLGARSVAWAESEIHAWVTEQIEAQK